MNTDQSKPVEQEQYAAFLAIDWADEQHVYTLQLASQTGPEKGTLEQKPEAIRPWVAQLRERVGHQPVAVAVEQSRGALIHALLEYDFLVIYPLHPNMVANFRAAFQCSGAKNDPGDTGHIFEILTKHLALLKPLHPDSEETRLLRRWVEDRRKAVDERTRHIQALKASLKEYYPQALAVLSGNVTTSLAGDFLKKWPTFPAFQQAKPSTIKKFFYGHNIRSPKVIQKVLDIAQLGQPLTTDPAIVESSRLVSQLQMQLIQTLNPMIEQYDRCIEKAFHHHPEYDLFKALPGAGKALAPRLLSFFGSDRSRYASAEAIQSFTGIAPITIESGKSSVACFRRACPKFDRQTFHEFARLSVGKCQWARNFVDYYTDKKVEYHTIIRNLAYKWIRVLFKCWQARTPYDEAKYMKALAKRGSIFATYHLDKKS